MEVLCLLSRPQMWQYMSFISETWKRYRAHRRLVLLFTVKFPHFHIIYQIEGGRECFQFPCYCFHFLMFPDSSWCNVHEAEVKGKPRLDGNHTTSLSISCSVFSWNVYREKERENDDMAEWVSIAQKTNSGIDGDTGKHLISRFTI